MQDKFFRPVPVIVAMDPEMIEAAGHKKLMLGAAALTDALSENLTKENITYIEGLIGQFKADLTLVKAGLFPPEAAVS
jgi:hypothetical protein